jgi:hypothetical protein
MEDLEKLLIDALLRIQVLEKLLIDKKLMSEEELSKTMEELTLKFAKVFLENSTKNEFHNK